MELRSRSRSKTPFSQLKTVETVNSGNHVGSAIRTRRSANLIKSSGAVEYSYSTRSTRSSKEENKKHAVYKTSDYSSEDGESEVSSSRHISQNEKNQIIEDAIAAANGTDEVSALNLYRKAGRYWDKYPKTDWTYSPHSKDRVEIAPGVVAMPNMSRRTIHSYDSVSSSENYASDETDYIKSSRYVDDFKPQQLFTINNNSEDSFSIKRTLSFRETSITTKITRIFVYIYTLMVGLIFYVYRTQNDWIVWLAKKLHHFVSWIMLLDTWSMKKKKSGKGNKIKSVVLLCLIPLLLFGGWWLISSLGSVVYDALNTTSIVIPSNLVKDSDIPTKKITNVEIKSNADDVPNLSEKQLENIALTIKNSFNFDHSQNNDEFIINQQNVIDNLKIDLEKLRLELTKMEKSRQSDLDQLIARFRSETSRLTWQLNKCCRRINIDGYIRKLLIDLLNDPSFLQNQKGLSDYFNAIFLAKTEFESQISNLTLNLNEKFDALIADNSKRIFEKVSEQLSIKSISNNNYDNYQSASSPSDENLKRMIRNALSVYDADKTGLVDYAMEPMGGQVVTTKCTETYNAGSAVVSILGIPLYYPTNSPRTVITPGINPGECWAFQNFPGFLVIKLATRVKIEAFTLEHISKLLVPNGRIDSAPKDFEVYGLASENDRDPTFLGRFTYDIEGDSLQYFAAQHHGLIFDMIEVRIISNHGNPNYTCLYRFRIHGTVDSDLT